MRLTLLLALAVLSMTACTAGPGIQIMGKSCALMRVAELPVQVHDDMLFVRAAVGGVPVTLLVDTGAERTLFTEAAVRRLRLQRDLQHATRTFGIGSSAATWDAWLPGGLNLGGIQLPLDSVTVGHFDIMQSAEGPADGLLGADVLLSFDVDLDLPRHRITFYQARTDCPQARPPWTEPYIGVAGIITQQDRLLVPFELDGVHGMGVLDTGAQVSSISQHMMIRLGLEEGELTADRMVMAHGAAPDQVKVRIHQFHEFRVGPAVMQSPVLPVVPMSSEMGDALVGADFLQGRRLWLSYSTRRVFVTPLQQGAWIAAAQPIERPRR